MKIKKTYRIEQSVIEILDNYCQGEKLNATEVIEHALCAYCTKKCEPEKPIDQNLAAVIEELRNQLKVKDEQIATLGESLKAAQTLHAVDKPQMALETREVQKSRWDRLRKAWRG